MVRKPKKGYKQLNGRPHHGLHYPEKYGLTYEEALKLVESGKWRSFLTQLNKKKRKLKKLKLLNFICPECKERKPDEEDWHYSGNVCKECKDRNNYKCSSCLGQPGPSHFRGVPLCESCLKILIKLMEESNASK